MSQNTMIEQNSKSMTDCQKQSVSGLTQTVLMDGKVLVGTCWKPQNMCSPEGEYIDDADGTSADVVIHTTVGVSGGLGKNAEGEKTVQTVENGLLFLVRSLHPGETTDTNGFTTISECEDLIGKVTFTNVFKEHGFAMKGPVYYGVSLRGGQDKSGILYLRSILGEDKDFKSNKRLTAAGIHSVDASEDIVDDLRTVMTDLSKVSINLTKADAETLGIGNKKADYTVSTIVDAVATRCTWIPYGESTGEGFESNPLVRIRQIRG